MTIPTLNFLNLRHPRVDGATQAKFYLTDEARNLLKDAAERTGLDMSAIVNNIVLVVLKNPESQAAIDRLRGNLNRPKPETRKRRSYNDQN